MNILVTGGMGAIGSFVTRLLVQMGHRPILYSRTKDATLLRDILPTAYDYTQGDILDLRRLTRTTRNYNIQRILHLSAMLDESQANPLLALKTNVQGTLHVLEAARTSGVERVVYASSKRAMGAITGAHAHPQFKPVTEEHPTRPVLVYDVTKLAAEHMGFNYVLNYNLDFVALRFAQTYGPGRLPRYGHVPTMFVHSKLIENAMLGKPSILAKGGDAIDDCIYTKDVAQGLVRACVSEGLKHRLFHVGTGQGYSLRDLANAIRMLYPKAPLEIGSGLDYREGWPRYNCIFDITRSRDELGFEPQYDLHAGVAHYVAFLQGRGIQPVHSLFAQDN